MAIKPKIFIGSSTESLPIARKIQQELSEYAHCETWKQGTFRLSQNYIEDLLSKLTEMDYGIFIFSPDDILKKRNSKKPAPRDNVIFETGLYMGRLGKNYTFILKPTEPEIHFPSDIAGVTTGSYDPNHGNLQAAVGPFCTQVIDHIQRNKLRPTKSWEQRSPFIELHHVNLPVTKLDRSVKFYKDLLELPKIVRVPYPFEGEWFGLPSGQHLHLIEIEKSDNITFLDRKELTFNPKDVHFAQRLEKSEWKRITDKIKLAGYKLKEISAPDVNVNQVYLLDPDGHIIEINDFDEDTRSIIYK